MRVLLDTHTFLWGITDEARLSARVHNLMSSGECWFSAASIWELIVKVQSGKMSLPKPVGAFLTSELANSGVQVLPISLDHVLRTESLEPHHRDPFDRILIAQSIVEGMPVLTVDPLFKSYPVQVIW